MKKVQAEALHSALIQQWKSERKPVANEHNLFCFEDYLEFAQNKRPDCLDFKCRAGPMYQAEMWFDYALKQSWAR